MSEPMEELQWIETTIRKGTKTPKICRDMFITEYKGLFKIGIVKNGRLCRKESISTSQASKLQRKHKLVSRKGVFNGSYTYRTETSNKTVGMLMAADY